MKRVDFPGCCTASVLHDLGGTDLSAGTTSELKEQTLENWLVKEISEARGWKCLVVMTNNEQKMANKLLKRHGFIGSHWMSKTQHPESKIRLWYLPPK